jgi:hypothetical protein
MVLHGRLMAITPRTFAVQRAGELVVKLNDIAGKLTKAGYAMSDAAERQEPAGHA